MKTTNPIFSLKNFRSFGKEGADFELAPITVLTGCNSAGKSSLVKALMLLSNQPKELKSSSSQYDIERYNPAIDLNINTKKLMLGQFCKVLNEKSGNEELYFSYRIWSDYLQEEVLVKRQFIPNKKDILNNGLLHSFIIEKTDGTCIYEIKDQGEARENVEAIKDNYYRFLLAVDYVRAEEAVSFFNSLKNRQADGKYKADKWLSNTQDKLKESNIHIEDYNKSHLSTWISCYHDDFNKSQWGTIIEKARTKEEIEETKRNSYMSLFVNEVLRPWFIKDVEYINSVSAIINRLYSSEDENKMNGALRMWNERTNFLHYEPSLPDMKERKPGSFLNNWIKKFQIGDSIEMEGSQEGLGFLIYLVKDGNKRLLADEGYGITQLVSLLLQIDNNIPIFTGPNISDFNNYHYVYPHKVICVEEPEVHLHPKYQSLLAEMFVEAYQKYNIHFIIETHSEYLIRKLQVMVADKDNSLTSNDVSLNYVEKDENGVSTNRKIEILEDGRLSEPFGPGFFDQADMLAMDLLKYKARKK